MEESSSEEDGEDGKPNPTSRSSVPNFFASVLVPLNDASASIPQHPSQSHIHTLCNIFLRNVDSVIRILHRPSVRAYMQEHQPYLDYEPGNKAVDALMFAIYYSSASSLTEEQSQQQFGFDRSVLLSRFRSDAEKALTRAEFLISEDLTSLQALVLYLIAVRSNVKTRLSWTLLGLAVRIANALGLNRESSFASLPPFQKEMRRRLWWQLCNADVQACFDRGSDLAIAENSFDTQKPLNVDDEDFSSISTVISAKPSSSFTQMTLALVSYESIAEYHRITYLAPTGWTEGDLQRLPEQKQYWVREFQRRLEDKYLQHLRGHLDSPLQWLARMVGDIIVSIHVSASRSTVAKGGSFFGTFGRRMERSSDGGERHGNGNLVGIRTLSRWIPVDFLRIRNVACLSRRPG